MLGHHQIALYLPRAEKDKPRNIAIT